MTEPVLAHLLVPVANESDASETVGKLETYVDPEVETVTVVHVIEKTEGYMDKAPLEAREEQAERVFSIVEEAFENGPEIRRELRYGTDVVDEIVAAADELDATAIAFTPQSGGRLQRLLSGDTAYRLISESHQPVVVFSRDLEAEE